MNYRRSRPAAGRCAKFSVVRRRGAWLIFLSVLLTAFAAAAAGASAATRYVAVSGADGANGCLEEAHPCKTIGHALGKAAAGDTVSVAAGTYAESNFVGRAVTIVGAGAGTVLEPSTSLQSPILTAAHDLIPAEPAAGHRHGRSGG